MSKKLHQPADAVGPPEGGHHRESKQTDSIFKKPLRPALARPMEPPVVSGLRRTYETPVVSGFSRTYSARSASSGSIRRARRPGIRHAANAAIVTNADTATNTTGSRADTPNSNPLMNW